MRKQWKIMICLLLSITILFIATACTTETTVEKEIKTITTDDGIQYIIINKVATDGTVLEEYAKVAKYLSNEKDIVFIPDKIENIPVKTITSRAFFESNIINIEISQGIERIESFAFAYANNLVTVTLSSSIEFIGDYAFSNCLALKSVTFQTPQKPELGKEAFKFFDKKSKQFEVSSLLKIYVPSKEEYKQDNARDNWKDYQDYLYEKEVSNG